MKQTYSIIIITACGVLGLALIAWFFQLVINIPLFNPHGEPLITGRVISTTESSTELGTRYHFPIKIFTFRLDNLADSFSLQRPYKSPTNFPSLIRVGDTLSVYYNREQADEGLTVYEIDKGGRIIVPYVGYDKNVPPIIMLPFVAGLVLIILGLIQFYQLSTRNFLRAHGMDNDFDSSLCEDLF